MPKTLEDHEDVDGEGVLDPLLDIVGGLPATWLLGPHAAHTHLDQDRFAPVKPFPFLGRRLDREQIV